MLDIKALRADPDAARDALGRRNDPEVSETLEEALELDRERRELIGEVEELRALRNETSEEIGERKRRGEEAEEPIRRMREVKERIDRYFDAGVDTVIIGLLEGAVDPREAARSIAPSRG